MGGLGHRSWGLGFAGAGWLGESLIKELAGTGGLLTLAGVQDVNGALAAEVAGRYGGPDVWSGEALDDLLAAPRVDAVVISTPNALHVPQALAALCAGKHVLVQKPLATSLSDAERAVAEAAKANRLLFVDYTYRFLETVRVLREALPGIGRVTSVEGVFRNIYGPGKPWFFDPAMSGGGALVDLGVHLLDLALDLTRPEHVRLESVALQHVDGLEVESRAGLQLGLDEVPFSLEVTWNEPVPVTDIHLQLTGENGVLRWENVDGSFFRFRTLLGGTCLLDRETSLREDTLRSFLAALDAGSAPLIDLRVYDLLDQAYGAVQAR